MEQKMKNQLLSNHDDVITLDHSFKKGKFSRIFFFDNVYYCCFIIFYFFILDFSALSQERVTSKKSSLFDGRK